MLKLLQDHPYFILLELYLRLSRLKSGRQRWYHFRGQLLDNLHLGKREWILSLMHVSDWQSVFPCTGLPIHLIEYLCHLRVIFMQSGLLRLFHRTH